MAYTIKDHGTWAPYTPDPLPDWARQTLGFGGAVVFLRREGDGVDFYEFRRSEPFAAGAVLATVLLEPATGIETVKTAFRDADRAFPLNQRLIEVDGSDPDADPQAALAEKVFDPATLTLSEPPPPPGPTSCTKLGLKRALGDRWPAVRAAIAADPDMQEEWDLAVSVNRAGPFVAKMQAHLDLSDAQVSALIAAAAAAR